MSRTAGNFMRQRELVASVRDQARAGRLKGGEEHNRGLARQAPAKSHERTLMK